MMPPDVCEGPLMQFGDLLLCAEPNHTHFRAVVPDIFIGCEAPLFDPPPDWIRRCGELMVGEWRGQRRCAQHLAQVSSHTFVGQQDLDCEECGLPDRAYVHNERKALREAADDVWYTARRVIR